MAARAQELQVIDLNFRMAQDLIPILQPLLEPGGVLTGTDDVLFVRTSPENLAQIRAALATLDRAPRQLLVSVGQGNVREVATTDVEGTATLGSGDVQVGVNRPPGADSGASVTIRGRRQQADLHNVSSVRVLEGTETWIGAGQSVPLTETTVQQRPGGVVQQTTTFRDVGTGFYATARLSGERVVLDISARQQRVRSASGTISTQGATTTVSGRLGEWFPLGGVAESGASSNGGVLTQGGRSESSQYAIWVKVDEL
jgi:type II secretory pathway component GspD/PulD (secretin)